MTEDIFIRLTDLPEGVYEFVSHGADGFTIYLSSRLTWEQRVDRYRHAVEHIRRGDFDEDKRGMDVDDVEREAHGKETA